MNILQLFGLKRIVKMPTKIHTLNIKGISAIPITAEVEIDVNKRKRAIQIIGLADQVIMESRKRIEMALKSSGFIIPNLNQIIINLSPASLRKEGTLLDMGLAVGILHASGLLGADTPILLNECVMMGELSFNGDVLPIKGALIGALETKKKYLLVPEANAFEASLAPSCQVIPIKNIRCLVRWLHDQTSIQPLKKAELVKTSNASYEMDFSDVRGQEMCKRALQIAAAGKHNILFFGAQGSGKTMMAKRIVTIMPPLTPEQMIETTKIYSSNGRLGKSAYIDFVPFRSPHHTTPITSLIGGGHKPQAGEISLAHNGVLFLDEMTEMDPKTINGLREPLENGYVDLARIGLNIRYPASFLLIGAYNPCPCGMATDDKNACKCSPSTIKKYTSGLSGPILDRFDMRIGIKSVEFQNAHNAEGQKNITSQEMKAQVMIAVEAQFKRFGRYGQYNAHMSVKDIEKYCQLDDNARQLIQAAFQKFNMSMRSYHKTLKLARTIADMESAPVILPKHIAEALMYKFEEA